MPMKKFSMNNISMKKALTVLSLVMILASTFFGYSGEVHAETEHQEKAVKAANLPSNGLDVMLVVDNSKSVWSQQEARNEALRCLGSLAVGGDINMGCVYFADHLCNAGMKLQSMEDAAQAKDILAQSVFHMKEQDTGNIDTNIGVGLQAAVNAFADQNPSRKRAVILFSDGINENLAQNPAYKKAADAFTKEQAQILKDKNVEIYCVYLQKKNNRENTDYLKQLVNYFEDVDYAADRFKSVNENDIDTLSEEFAKIFYAVQNGMKYKTIDLSAGGKTSFYIPSMGVSKLQIFLKNDNAMEVTLKCLEEDSDYTADSWQDGGNAFITVGNPPSGQWELLVSGKDSDKTAGTIAYYTDISCYTELVDVTGGTDVHKNSTVKIKASFYNGQKEELDIDKAAQLEGTVSYYENGQKVTDHYPLHLTENGAESEEFMIRSYGEHVVETTILYDEFVDLSYPMPAVDIKPGDFIICPMTDENFHGYKSNDGIRFTIKETKLIQDPEGEQIFIEKVAQGNQDNPVTVELQDGYFIVTAKKTGDLQFAISVIDESGTTGVVSVEGKVQNKQVVDIMTGGMYGLFLILFLLFIRSILKKNKLKKEIKEMKQVIGKKHGKALKNAEKFDLEEALSLYEKFGIMKEDILDYEDETTALAAFGLRKYIEENSDDQFRDAMVDVLTDATVTENRIKQLKKDADDVEEKGSVNRLRRKIRHLIGIEEEIDSLMAEMDGQYDVYLATVADMKEELEQIQEKFFEFDDMMQETITSTIKVRVNDGEYRGKMTAGNHTGYYSLVEDVKLLSRSGKHIETLKSLIGDQIPKIIVCNYQDDEGCEGLMLRSEDGFEIKESASSISGETVKQYDLMKGCAYKLTIRGMGYIELEVE
ncbi:MAG: VWA domain-containing protein [Lachnospiraceae bacterium]|nr:VWA domain-containing protein [Lachnospiraceae bacterium]